MECRRDERRFDVSAFLSSLRDLRVGRMGIPALKGWAILRKGVGFSEDK
jgi:hypothetical protein